MIILIIKRRINYDATDSSDGFPCWSDPAMTVYLNSPSVREALHVSSKLNNVKWQSCNEYGATGLFSSYNKGISIFFSYLNYNYTYFEMDDFFHYIVSQNPDIRILVFNGDVDLVCNFLGVQWFIENITTIQNLTVSSLIAVHKPV